MPVSQTAVPNSISFWESLFKTYTSSSTNPKAPTRSSTMPISKRSTNSTEKTRKLAAGAAPVSPQNLPYRRATIQVENPAVRSMNKRAASCSHAAHPPPSFSRPFNGVASPPDTPATAPATTNQPVEVCEHPLSNKFPPKLEPVDLNFAVIASLQAQNASLLSRLDENSEVIQNLQESQTALVERNEYLSEQTEGLRNELKVLYHRFENVKNKANALLADSTREITELTSAKRHLEALVNQLQLQLVHQSKPTTIDMEIARDIDKRQNVSLEEFLHFIYVRYPPPQPIPNLSLNPAKAEIVDAIRKYHPDKMGRYGERVRHIACEVTKSLSRRLEQYR